MTSDVLAVSADAAAVTDSVDFSFAVAVTSTLTETLEDAPGASTGSFCDSGLTRTPLTAFTRRVPFAVADFPVFVTLILIVFNFPTFRSSAFGLAIERTAGAGACVGRAVGAGAVGADGAGVAGGAGVDGSGVAGSGGITGPVNGKATVSTGP